MSITSPITLPMVCVCVLVQTIQVSKGRKETLSHFLWSRHIRSMNKTQEDRHDILTHTRTQNLTFTTHCGTTVTRGCKDQADRSRVAVCRHYRAVPRGTSCNPAGWQWLQITMLPGVVIKIQRRGAAASWHKKHHTLQDLGLTVLLWSLYVTYTYWITTLYSRDMYVYMSINICLKCAC